MSDQLHTPVALPLWVEPTLPIEREAAQAQEAVAKRKISASAENRTLVL